MEFLKNQDHHKSFNLLVKILAVFLIVFAFSGLVGAINKIREGRYIGQDIVVKNTISVSGTGEVYAKPNLGLINFSVKVEAKTVNEVMNQSNSKVGSIIEAVKEIGVEEKDLKTTDFNIYPRYEYQGLPSREERVLVGYDVEQTLEVKIRDLEKSGQIIQEATNAGANQVNDLIFTLDDEELKKNKDQAREMAIKEAKSQAKEIADQLGVNLVRIINFHENSYAPRYDMARSESGGIGGGGIISPQIETGENKIETNINIVYEIN